MTFVERDLTQAKLAAKVISIYCDENGGTMHTLRFAKRENKDIGCVMDCPGNRYAVRRLHARMLTNDAEIIAFAKEKPCVQMSMFDYLESHSTIG
jgi:predicted Rossmann fold nucleotide-binding protein DprA/Smf involved in DNA uptake